MAMAAWQMLSAKMHDPARIAELTYLRACGSQEMGSDIVLTGCSLTPIQPRLCDLRIRTLTSC